MNGNPVEMDLAGLQTFEMVARLGTLSKAAQALNCVPSNVTSRIKALEHEFGVTLFHRHSRGMLLTSEGRTLLPYARHLVQLVDDANQAFTGGNTPVGYLRLGATETTLARRLPVLLKYYHEQYPCVELEITTDSAQGLVDDVLNFTLDGAFVSGPVNHPMLNEDHVSNETLVLVSSSKHKTIKSILKEKQHPTLIVHKNGCLDRQKLESLLHARGIVSDRRIVLGTIDGILACVQADLGVSIFKRAALGEDGDLGISIHEIPVDHACSKTVFVTRRVVTESRAMRQMRIAISDIFADGAASLGATTAHLGRKRRSG